MSDRSRLRPGTLSDRHADLLADRAVWGLTPEEARELDLAGLAADPSFDLAAAAADLAFAARAAAPERLPEALRARIEADALARFTPPQPLAFTPKARAPWLPWLLAACATFAALASWWPSAQRPGTTNPADPAALRQLALREGAGVWTWTDFKHPLTKEDPEVRGVSGDVVWNEPRQQGYMRLAGLPRNNPAVERYQLWIIDERGLGQRVNGGVFDVTQAGEIVIPFTPDLPIHHAALFAVTIEKPEGVVVSDMTRRACAAAVTPAPTPGG